MHKCLYIYFTYYFEYLISYLAQMSCFPPLWVQLFLSVSFLGYPLNRAVCRYLKISNYYDKLLRKEVKYVNDIYDQNIYMYISNVNLNIVHVFINIVEKINQLCRISIKKSKSTRILVLLKSANYASSSRKCGYIASDQSNWKKACIRKMLAHKQI